MQLEPNVLKVSDDANRRSIISLTVQKTPCYDTNEIIIKGGISVSEQFIYDAFISYRHLPLDMKISESIQNRLEQYRPPKLEKIVPGTRIKRIFRDKTELPTSSDLSGSLKDALLHSRFLIIVLSEETKNSLYCMEEIRVFKEAHGETNQNILPVLISGEPKDVIPDILRYDEREGINGERIQVEVEPICCDVRAESAIELRRKMKTEILRLAAPILGCGYDDLYQRHVRRQNRIRMAAIGILTVILGIISVLGVITFKTQQKYKKNLVDTYTRQGAEQIVQNDVQKALMYYTSALQLDPSDQAAKTGALQLLLQNNWLSKTGEIEGQIIDGRYFPGCLYARAVNKDGSRVLATGQNTTDLTDAEGSTLRDLSEYGEYIQSADDGSCWTFANEDTITFYFTEDERIWQVPRPTKVNPACRQSSIDLHVSELHSAMAINRGRGVVCWAGYLYLYNFNEDGTYELFQEFDLAKVFYVEAEARMMEYRFDTWIDAGNALFVVSDSNNVAIFDVASVETPHLTCFYTDYSHYLNDVAFSEDGESLVMAFGNDMGYLVSGGSIVVYRDADMSINEFDLDTPLLGAEFEPGDKRFLIWGTGFLQLWNFESMEAASAPLYLSNITPAAWGENGSVLVDTGLGHVDVYQLISFAASNAASEEKPDGYEFDRYSHTASLENGMVFRRTATEIFLEDGTGTMLSSLNFGDIDDEFFMHEMYIDKNSFGFFWFRDNSNLYRVLIDQENNMFAHTALLNTEGSKVVNVYPAADGTIVNTANGYLMYFGYEDTLPRLKLSVNGLVQDIATDDNGLAAVTLKSIVFSNKDSASHDKLYSLELWDLNKGILLGNLEKPTEGKIENLFFTSDGYLIYQKGNNNVAHLLDASDPDESEIDNIAGICCYKLNEKQYPEIKTALFTDSHHGNWSEYIYSSLIIQEKVEKKALIVSEHKQILQENGIDAWLDYVDKMWTEAAQSDFKAAELQSLFKDCVNIAYQNNRIDHLRSAFECMINKAIRIHPTAPEYESFADMFLDFAQLTDTYDDLLIYYWSASAYKLRNYIEKYSHQIKESDRVYYFYDSFVWELYAYLLKGEGMDAFCWAMYVNGYDDMQEILEATKLEFLFWIMNGDPETAAYYADRMLIERYSLYGKYGADEFDEHVHKVYDMAFDIVNMLVKRGFISEEDRNIFMDSLQVTIGFQLKQLTAENIELGLRIGDVIVDVNGTRTTNALVLTDLMNQDSAVRITFLRNGLYYAVDFDDNRMIAGNFIYKHHFPIIELLKYD